MEIITVPINAGETKVLHVAGEYFEVIEAVDPLDVFLYHPSGGQSSAIQAVAGVYLRIGYKEVQIKSQTAQTLRVMVAEKEGGTRRQSGSVDVTNTVSVEVQGIAQVVEAYNPLKLLNYKQWAALNDRLYTLSISPEWELIQPANRFDAGAFVVNPAGSGKNVMILAGSYIKTKTTDFKADIFICETAAFTPGAEMARRTTAPAIGPTFAKGNSMTGAASGVISVGNVIAVACDQLEGGYSIAKTDADIILKPGHFIIVSGSASSNTNDAIVDIKFIEME